MAKQEKRIGASRRGAGSNRSAKRAASPGVRAKRAASPGARAKRTPEAVAARAKRTSAKPEIVAAEAMSDAYRRMRELVEAGEVTLPVVQELIPLLEGLRDWAEPRPRPKLKEAPQAEAICEIGWLLDGAGGLRGMQLAALQVQRVDAELAQLLSVVWTGVGVWMY